MQILYDQTYTDTVREITQDSKLPEEGIMLIEYTGTTTELNIMMNAATKNTVSIVLCRPTFYLEIFQN
ncbi:hypothetical protein SK128_015645, partial [Halocaridina rubra]